MFEARGEMRFLASYQMYVQGVISLQCVGIIFRIDSLEKLKLNI